MGTTYFNYVISQCRTTNISQLNGIFESVDHLRESSHIFFDKEYMKLVDDKDLINETFLYRIYIENNHPLSLADNTKIVYNRCIEKLDQLINFDCSVQQHYDELFNTLVDYCWLMSSMQYCIDTKETAVKLLISPMEIKENTEKLLVEIYNSAIDYYNESVYVTEALEALKSNNWGDYPFRYKESPKYIIDSYPIFSLEHIYKFNRDRSKGRLALFFGLSATNIRADEIRRGFYDPIK